MASPIAPTYGVWLVSIWIQTLLQGCGMLQIWLYFHWYKNDSWGIKAMVFALLVTETFQSIVFFQVTYIYLIDGFGDLPGLFVVRWQDSAQLFATYLSAFIVQMYFGYCIYILWRLVADRLVTVNRKNKIFPGIICALALVQIGSGLAQTIRTLRLTSFAQIGSTKAITTVEAAAAFLCDIVITASLVYNLGSRKTGVKSTNSLLDGLMINSINRGMLTALCALSNLILFLALPGTFYFFIGLTASGKLYMNSALATLNSRQHVYSKAHRGQGTWNTMPMNSMSGQTAAAGEGDSGVRVVVTKQSATMEANRSDYDLKNSTFIDGML